MFNFLKSKSITPEEKFWDWFVKNKAKVEEFIVSNNRDYGIYNQLTKEIKKYNPLLFPEITMTEFDQYVLIITPDGLIDGIPPTQSLFDKKPDIENWLVRKFRQPTDEIDLNFNGVEFPSHDIEILPVINNEEDKIDIRVFIRDMNRDEKNYQSLAFLYLDHILGEFNTMTKIGFVDFYHLDHDKSIKNSISILELRKLIDRELYRVTN